MLCKIQNIIQKSVDNINITVPDPQSVGQSFQILKKHLEQHSLTNCVIVCQFLINNN